MRTLSSSDVVRVGAAIRTVSRRLRRFAFRYDALELRQLLSVGQAVARGAVNPVIQPAVSVAPLFESPSSDWSVAEPGQQRLRGESDQLRRA